MKWWKAPLLLLTSVACGRAAAQEPEFEQSCGGVVDSRPEDVARCIAPTESVEGNCRLTQSGLSGQCAPGYRFDSEQSACVIDTPDPKPPEQRKQERAAATALVHDGRSLLEAGRPEEAIDYFQRAARYLPHPVVWAELAGAQETAGHVAAALVSWRMALASEAPTSASPSPERAEKLEAIRVKAREHIAELEKRMAHLRIELPSDLKSPEVAIDRARYALALVSNEMGVTLEPGQHEVVVTAIGRAPWLMRVELSSGPTLTLAASLGR